MFCHSLHLICFDLTSQEPCHLLFSIQKLKLFSLLKIKEGLKQSTEIALLFLMRVFSKLAYLLPFSLETSRYALVAKALHYKTAFSATPESEDSFVAEN